MAVVFDASDARERLSELNYRLQTVSDQGVAARASLRAAITNAAQGIADKAKQNVHNISGDMAKSIRANRAVLHKGGGMKVTVSTHAPIKYAGPLEYGHGGPHPAPAHPYLRPAFDEKKDEAYAAIVDAVIELMNDLGI